MVPWPAFLSFPFSLPSLPSISLPTDVQRRFLSYVLKRALGRFIRSGLDVDKIQSQIGEGRVEIEGLVVDEDEINSLIPSSLPIRLTSGVLDRVTARIPFPNLWSDPLTLTLENLTLDFDLIPPSTSTYKGKSPEFPFRPSTTSRYGPSPTSPTIDLAASVTSAADEFLHEELDAYEEAELDRSIRESLIISRSDPFVKGQGEGNVPGAFPSVGQDGGGRRGDGPLPVTVESSTVLAGLVERILARLGCTVKNIKIRLHHHGREGGSVLELRIGHVGYADETASLDQQTGTATTTRTIRVNDIGVYLMSSAGDMTSGRQRYSSASRTSSMSSTSTDSDDHAEMYMSQAVADLRQSVVSEIGSDASIYHSATGEDLAPEVGNQEDQATEGDRSTTPTGTRTSDADDDDACLIVNFGSEELVIRLQTTRSTGPDLTSHAQSRQITSSIPSISLDVSIGTVAVLLLPSHMATLLQMSQVFTQASTPPGGLATTTETAPAQMRTDARLLFKGVYVIAVYDMTSDSSLSTIQSHLASYWARPSSFHIPVGHLKLKLEGIEATYAAPAQSPQRTTSHTSSRPLPRRSSTTSTIKFGPKPPHVTLRLSDASLFEYIATDTTPTSAPGEPEDAIPGGAYPILLFDNGLPKQYESTPTGLRQAYGPARNTFPEFDQVDWRNSGLQKRSGGGERLWRVRPKARGALKTTMPFEGDTHPVLAIKKEMSPYSAAVVDLQPVHVFLDLSMVERLLPVLRYVSPSIQTSRNDKDATPHHSPTTTQHHLPSHYVLNDLDAQASSIATLQPSRTAQDLLVVHCPLVRLDIRCPAPVNRRGSWGDGAHLRSGIVTLDIHGLDAAIKRPGQNGGSGGGRSFSNSTVEPKASIGWQKMLLFFSRVPDKRASAFLVVGPLQPDPTDIDVLLPVVEIRSATNSSNLIKTSTITIRIPSVQAKIRQRTIEGLQFFADDITHWLDGAFGDGSAPKPRDDLKMIGSRFFGSKASSSASSSAEEDEEEDLTTATVLRLLVTEADVILHVPRRPAPDIQTEVEVEERVLSLKASDLDVKLESNTTGRQETALILAILDAEFADRTDPINPSRILARTTPLSLTTNNSPIVQLRFSSLTHPQSGFKETGIKLTLSSCTAFVTKDLSWAKDLARFAKTPEGVFEDVVPSEVTRVGISLYDCGVHIKSPNLDGAIVLVVSTLEAKTDIEGGSDTRAVEMSIGSLGVLAVDDMAAVTQLQGGQASSLEGFKRAGYAQLADLLAFELQVMQDSSGDGEILVDILRAQLRVTACADSMVTFGALAGDIASLATTPKGPPAEVVRSPSTLEHSVDVFASIDENAFNQIPDIGAGADLIEDDLPTNLDYLDTTTRPHSHPTDRPTGESLRSWQATSEEGATEGGDSIRILLDTFDAPDDYWETLPATTGGYGDDAQIGKTRVRVHDASLAIYLHEGYDWVKTRKIIEEEMKAVRRRLEKIRQLLASGQKADESFDRAATSSTLFNSVYIGLDQHRDSLDDTAALLAAIDEELEDMAGETEMNTQSSWQTLPGAPPHAGSAPIATSDKSRKIRLHGRRLTRSKKAQIEINLNGIKSDVDIYGPEDDIASRLHTTIQAIEILDHIKTSTWKKFLTEMKSDSRGNMRETDADMLRFELMAVRPSLPSLSEESRLRAKILPLRLHVDQDALDFLKRFFTFSIPTPGDPTATSAPKKSPSTEPFLQHVEIYPIELKLDYKPKRVDFAALREGKTMELMNFFHFDGAEMTLRHITLSGITGWDRLSTTLQDIWTPDVKANQIADIISGVSPIRSLVNVGSGVADLILLPIEQYRKDGRVARGVQKGTNSFVKSTAMEMMKLGARLATGTQVVLEKAEGALGGRSQDGAAGGAGAGLPTLYTRPDDLSDTDDVGDAATKEVLSRYANQPASTSEGLQEGYKAMSRNLNSAAQTILAVPMEVYERSGDNGPLRAVVRAVPIAVLKPMIGASEAVSKTLLGMRNSLDPQGRRELVDKYK